MEMLREAKEGRVDKESEIDRGDQVCRVALSLWVSGRVQGVGFRSFCLECATSLQVLGVVRNLKDGRVELDIEGDRDRIEALILKLRQGPPRSRVTDIEVSWHLAQAAYQNFSIAY